MNDEEEVFTPTITQTKPLSLQQFIRQLGNEEYRRSLINRNTPAADYLIRNAKTKTIGKELTPYVQSGLQSVGEAWNQGAWLARRGLLGPKAFAGIHAIDALGKIPFPDIPIDKGISHVAHEGLGIDKPLANVGGHIGEMLITRKLLKSGVPAAYNALNKQSWAHRYMYARGQTLRSNLDRMGKDLNIAKGVVDKGLQRVGVKPRIYKGAKPPGSVPMEPRSVAMQRAVNDAFSRERNLLGEYTYGSIVKPGSLFSKDYKGILSKPQPYAYAASTGGDQPNEFQQLVLKLEEGDSFPKLYDFPSNQPTPFISRELNEQLGPDGNRLEGLTYQEIQSIGRAAKTYELKRAYKDAATVEGYARMTIEVEKVFSDLLGDDFDRDLVRQYMLDVSKHETALTELQKITNDKTGKLWDKQHANALRNLEHSGRMLGNKGLFPAFNYPDVLDQTPLGKPIVKIEREGNRPDRFARGADFQRTLMRVLGKPLSLHESILYWYDQNMFYFWKETTPLQRQQLVDSSRTRSGGRIKSELTVAENINQALEAMKFGQETMSGKLGRPLTDGERLKALVDLATSELLKKRKYSIIKKEITGETIIGPDGKPIKTKSGKELKEKQIIQKKSNLKGPRQGNVFYDIDTGETTDYSPDPGVGSSWDIEDLDPDNKYSK